MSKKRHSRLEASDIHPMQAPSASDGVPAPSKLANISGDSGSQEIGVHGPKVQAGQRFARFAPRGVASAIPETSICTAENLTPARHAPLSPVNRDPPPPGVAQMTLVEVAAHLEARR